MKRYLAQHALLIAAVVLSWELGTGIAIVATGDLAISMMYGVAFCPWLVLSWLIIRRKFERKGGNVKCNLQ